MQVTVLNYSYVVWASNLVDEDAVKGHSWSNQHGHLPQLGLLPLGVQVHADVLRQLSVHQPVVERLAHFGIAAPCLESLSLLCFLQRHRQIVSVPCK